MMNTPWPVRASSTSPARELGSIAQHHESPLSQFTMATVPHTLPPMESTESFNPDFNSDFHTNPNPNGHHGQPSNDAAAPTSPIDASAPAEAPHSLDQTRLNDAPDPRSQQQVHEVLHSDIGVNTLLNRLKASIASARVRRPLHCAARLSC
jgi:hypothetical protein